MDAADFSFITDSKEYQIMPKATKAAAVTPSPKIKKIHNILAGLLQFVADEEDKPEGERADAGELAQLQELVEKAAPVIQAIGEIGVVASGEAEEDIDEDADIVLDDDNDDKRKQALENNRTGGQDTMDAADIQKAIKQGIRAGVAEAMKGMQPVQDAKDVIATIRAGERLAQRASLHIGNFDAVMDGKDWTEQDVAVYVAEKVGLGCTAETAVVSVNAWLHGRVAPSARSLTLAGLSSVQDGKDKQPNAALSQFTKNGAL
jgi:hypothetical protein